MNLKAYAKKITSIILAFVLSVGIIAPFSANANSPSRRFVAFESEMPGVFTISFNAAPTRVAVNEVTVSAGTTMFFELGDIVRADEVSAFFGDIEWMGVFPGDAFTNRDERIPWTQLSSRLGSVTLNTPGRFQVNKYMNGVFYVNVVGSVMPPEYYALYRMLNSSDFEMLFGTYTAFTDVYIDEINLLDVYLLGLTSDVRRAFILGGLRGNATDLIMNNPQSVRAIVRDLVNNMAGNTIYTANKDADATLNVFSSLVNVANDDPNISNVGPLNVLFDTLRYSDALFEVLNRTAQDYSQNIAILESIRELHSSPLFRRTVDDVIRRYQRDVIESLVAFGLYLYGNMVIDEVVRLIAGAPTVALTSTLDAIITGSPRVSGLETIIVTDNFNLRTIEAFRTAARVIASGDFNSADVESYRNIFYMARGLQIMRYEAKRGAFNVGSREMNFINAQLGRLNRMTHDHFIYSDRFTRTGVAGDIEFPGRLNVSAQNQNTTPAQASANDSLVSLPPIGNTPPVVNLPTVQSFNDFPLIPITRADFAALAVAFYEMAIFGEIAERMTFNDTTDINIQKMGGLGIMSGVGNGNFAPNDPVTREQAAVMFARLADSLGQPLPQGTATFSDRAQISPWALASVGQVQAAGIMGDVGNNRFAPSEAISMEESIIVLIQLDFWLLFS